MKWPGYKAGYRAGQADAQREALRGLDALGPWLIALGMARAKGEDAEPHFFYEQAAYLWRYVSVQAEVRRLLR